MSQELIPAIDLKRLPPLAGPDVFVSQLANCVDFALSDLGSQHSRRTYTSRLKQVARVLGYEDPRTVPWERLRYEHVVAIKRYLTETVGSSYTSVNVTMSALRAVSRAAFNLKRLSADDLRRIENVKLVRGHRLPAGREVKLGELAALVQVCSSDLSAAGARDALIIGLLYICGLRRLEAAKLDVHHFDPDTATLKVIGKGNKERGVYPDTGTCEALDDWLWFRGDMEGPLLLAVRKDGEVNYANGRLSDQAIYNVIQKRARQAGVKTCSPHDFRRSFATQLLRQGRDLNTVKRLMGHSDVKTTANYDQRPDEEARQATEGLHLPYQRRREQ